MVAINRALAIAEMHGAAAGLAALPEAAADARLAEYQPYWAARAELLARTGAHDEAWHAYEIAIGLERDGSGAEISAGATAGGVTAAEDPNGVGPEVGAHGSGAS